MSAYRIVETTNEHFVLLVKEDDNSFCLAVPREDANKIVKLTNWERNQAFLRLLLACESADDFFYGKDGQTWRGEKNMKGILEVARRIRTVLNDLRGVL